MSSKQTEWKRIYLSKDAPDLSRAAHVSLETDGDSFIAVTFKLKCGRVVRIRKNSYDVTVEEPVVQMDTKYLAKTPTGLTHQFNTRDEADRAIADIDGGEVVEISVPRAQVAIESKIDEIPF
jgi:hypothetical protein